MAVAAGVTAWIEYSGVSAKMTRYTNDVIGLQNLLLWWDSISDVEKASASTINHLVETTESLILMEVSARVGDHVVAGYAKRWRWSRRRFGARCWACWRPSFSVTRTGGSTRYSDMAARRG